MQVAWPLVFPAVVLYDSDPTGSLSEAKGQIPLAFIQLNPFLRINLFVLSHNFTQKFDSNEPNYYLYALVNWNMIQTFADKETEKIWYGHRSTKLPSEIQQICRRKLRMLNNAQTITDMRIPPSNRLKKMKGKFKQYHSIRINNQWRIKFKWANNNAFEVEITDYHE